MAGSTFRTHTVPIFQEICNFEAESLKNKAKDSERIGAVRHDSNSIRDCGHEQLISKGGRFKTTFAERDKKQTMMNLRGISRNWL